MIPTPKKNLVLVGGGQTHAPVLKKLGMYSPDNVKITLISANSIVPYSGMLPGYIAGTYSKEECLIDLRHVSKFAGAVFVQANVTGLDLKNKLVLLENRPPISYDILSLNVGIVPDLNSVIGKEYIVPIKPVIAFFYKWIQTLSKIKKGDYGDRFRVGILGAGAGGIETALNIQRRIMKIIPNVEIHIFQRRKEILASLNTQTQRKVAKLLEEKKIHLHLNEEIYQVIANRNYFDCKTVRDNLFQLDYLVGLTRAKPLEWLEKTELAKDENGFILVNDFLESTSHPNVFAVGDIASMQNHPRPKAGVFAVRQSIPLYKNLVHAIENSPCEKFKPQKDFLTLLNTGDGRAIASRGNFSLGASKWIWIWKNKIDTNFMKRFQNLPVKMPRSLKMKRIEDFQCRGSGGKASADLLQIALDKLEIHLAGLGKKKSTEHKYAKTLVGLKERDDASLIQISQKIQLAQSVDFFKPMVDDLFIAGKIAANHSLNNLYAKGINAHSALAIINLDKNTSQSSEDLFQVLAGTSSIFSEEGVELLGGHTNSGKGFGLGFVCNGFLVNKTFYSKKNAKTGESIILTKPLGIGLIFAAEMRNKVTPLCVDAAIQSMLLSNFKALDRMRKFNISSCTDVSGFGLAGHLVEILKASKLNARLDLKKIPVLFELEKIFENSPEIQSSLFPSNWKSFEKYFFGIKSNSIYQLLFDPQTSGGLLFTLPAKQAEKCIIELKSIGYDASIIGSLLKPNFQKEKLVECV